MGRRGSCAHPSSEHLLYRRHDLEVDTQPRGRKRGDARITADQPPAVPGVQYLHHRPVHAEANDQATSNDLSDDSATLATIQIGSP